MKKKRSFKLSLAFAFVALCPFIVSSYLAGCAKADRPDITQVQFVEVQNTPETLKKYPFSKADFDDIKNGDQAMAAQSHLYIGEVKGSSIKDFFVQRVEGPMYCGTQCDLTAYVKTGAQFKQVIAAMSMPNVYVQTCPNETSLLLAGSGTLPLGVWTYTPQGFVFKRNYVGLDSVPPCPKN